MKNIYLLPLIAVLFFVSCKKNKDTGDDNLVFYANEVKIYPLNIYGKEAVLSFVDQHKDPAITETFQIKKSSESDWQDMPFTDKNNIPLSGLSTKTSYDARVTLSRGGVKAYSPVISFTTQSFQIDYDRFYKGPANLHDDANGIFSIEGAKYVLHGEGFTNESAIRVTLVAIDNHSDVVYLDAAIVDDSTLSFQIPNDLIRNEPYVRQKVYSCIIGEIPLVGHSSFLQRDLHVAGDLTIMNKDIVVDKFTITASACTVVHFEGFFGTHETETKCPAYLYGVSLLMKERKLFIYKAGVLVREVNMHPYISAVCDGDGYTAPDVTALSRSMLQYHEATDLSIRTTLSPGAYTMQVRQVTLNGTVLLSNTLPFSL